MIELLNSSHDKHLFDCGVPALDRYLKQQASQDQKRHIAVVFVLASPEDRKRIIGYYSLSSISIILNDIPSNLQKKLPSYPSIPATLLGRLAIDQAFQKRRLGEKLLVDALRRSYQASLEVGSWAVIVDAIDQRAAQFYSNFGFLPLQESTLKLFLPMKIIKELL